MPKRRRTPAAALLAALTLGALLTGCNNLWEWTADEGSYEALVADGREAMRRQDYDTAVDKLAEAVDLLPDRGEARYYLAKASVLQADVDVIDIVQTLTDSESDGAAEAIFEFETPKANRIYGVNRVVVEQLDPIHTGEASTDGLRGADVDLDLAVAYTLRGILRLRDTNGDGVIDGNDLTIAEFGISSDGGEYELEGIDNVPPEDLNLMIDDLNGLLADGGDLADNLDAGGIDSEELGDLIDDLGGDLSAYYVNTGDPGNPGEGDNDGDGTTDEECLNDIDDDLDGFVDEDSRAFGCP